VRGIRESLLRLNRDVCNLELYSLAQGYRRGMSSFILWLWPCAVYKPLRLGYKTVRKMTENRTVF